MACKPVPSFSATEGINNITVRLGDILITTTTAAETLEEMTAAAAAAEGVVVVVATAEAVVDFRWFNIKDMHPFCITMMVRTRNCGEEASSRPEQHHSLEGPSNLGTQTSRLSNSSRV